MRIERYSPNAIQHILKTQKNNNDNKHNKKDFEEQLKERQEKIKQQTKDTVSDIINNEETSKEEISEELCTQRNSIVLSYTSTEDYLKINGVKKLSPDNKFTRKKAIEAYQK